jgi:TonB family protein
MNSPSIRKTAALSAAIHATLFLVAILVMSHTSRLELPSPYVVSLVSPSDTQRAPGGASVKESSPPERAAEKRGIAMEKEAAKTSKKTQAEEEKRIEDKIAELAALKKVERIAKIRRAIVDIKGGSGKSAAGSVSKKPAIGSQGSSSLANYTDRIKAEIHQYWAIPDTIDKNLTATVAVRILKDGTVYILGMEKPSGNRVFDTLARKAIERASPVTRPPQEMELGIRFYPREH